MDAAGYRLRDQQAGCTGPVTVHRAEILGRPGRLVRVTSVTGTAAGPRAEALIDRWRTISHPALVPIISRERHAAGLLLTDPLAAARPLECLEPDPALTSTGTLARVGRAIAAGLQALHDAGLVHGAVSGHTILLGPDRSAVLDGPWHAACTPAQGRPDPATASEGADAALSPVDDVRGLAVTLLDHLDALPGDDSPGARETLRSVLEDHRDRSASAAALGDALVRWQGSSPQRPSGPDPTGTPGSPGTTSDPVPAPQFDRPSPVSVPGALTDAVRGTSSAERRQRAGLALAAIAGVLLLSLGSVPLWSSPAPSAADVAPSGVAAPGAAPSGAASSGAAAPGPPPADLVQPSAGSARTARPAATAPAVCADQVPPPGPGRLVLADLDGRGCRAPVRVDGPRLALSRDDGRPIEVALDLEVGDQVRVGDLDGSGRDEVLVYRPSTGELFRFAGLAGPDEERVATGEATGWRGGTAVLLPSVDGADRLEVRGGTPACVRQRVLPDADNEPSPSCVVDGTGTVRYPYR